MIKTIILVLAISAVAIASTEAYENPWTKDSINGACNKGEVFQLRIIGGLEFAQCMEIKPHGNHESCSPPPNFETTKLSAYATMYGEHNTDRACVVECSDDKFACPGNSQCMTAPVEFTVQTPQIRNICYYPRAEPVVPVLPRNDYENPWVGGTNWAECNDDEKVAIYEDVFGRLYAHCMPVVTEYNIVGNDIYCPKPPAFRFMKKGTAKVTESGLDTVCVNECSESLSCANGAYCMTLPWNRQSLTVQKACMYVKPRPWIIVEEIDITVEIDIYTA